MAGRLADQCGTKTVERNCAIGMTLSEEVWCSQKETLVSPAFGCWLVIKSAMIYLYIYLYLLPPPSQWIYIEGPIEIGNAIVWLGLPHAT